MKIDYNIDVGEQFDPLRPAAGDVLQRHVLATTPGSTSFARRYPKLVIENCSSGGLRFDLGIIAHTHTTWLSDVVAPQALRATRLRLHARIHAARSAITGWSATAKDGNGEPGNAARAGGTSCSACR